MAKEQKNKKDMRKIATKIMAMILAGMMVLSVGATLIYYIIAMAQG